MQLGQRALLLGVFAHFLLCGCDFDSAASSNGTLDGTGGSAAATGGGPTHIGNNASNPGVVSTSTEDSVVATLSVVGTLSVAAGASQALSITFTSVDGVPLPGFAISNTTLPPGWSGPDGFTCTAVGTGNGCILTLTYAPTVVETGTLELNYIFINDPSHPRTPGGSLSIPYAATTPNNIVATASPIGQINASVGASEQSLSVNFTTDDGNAATNLTVTSALAALPSGWKSTATGLSCAIVSSGSGCQLVLNYAPKAAASGTLTLGYSYTDDSGASRTGALNIPYAATSGGEVVATTAPTGQIIAVEKTGRQAVTVTFTTDDDKAAQDLYLISDLTTLPPGWKSSSNFSCASVNTGNGCQLVLNYAPAVLASGTLTLNYAYFDHTGTFKTGSANVMYAATTNDNVVGTAAPSGQINAIVGQAAQPVSVTFTTDDARPATAFLLTSALAPLPVGWSSSASSFACSGLSTGSACELTLMYAPPAADSGTLTLAYAYNNNAGDPKTGSLNIAYRATTDDNVVATPNPTSLAVLNGTSTQVNVTFTTDDGNLASGLSVTSGLAPLPAGWSSAANTFSCSSMSVGASCQLSLTYAPAVADAGTLIFGFSYVNNSGFTKTGTVSLAYAAGP